MVSFCSCCMFNACVGGEGHESGLLTHFWTQDNRCYDILVPGIHNHHCREERQLGHSSTTKCFYLELTCLKPIAKESHDCA